MRKSLNEFVQKQNWHIYAILAVTILTRFLFLDLRPPHFDEGINGYFVDQMWIRGFYDYDPTNYHGPLHFYFLQLFEVLFGRGIDSFRAVTATISVLTVGLILMHRVFIGSAAVWAAVIVALSPGAVFIGRYSIHEVWLPFSLILMNYGFMRWFQKKDVLSQILFFAGIAIGLMNKETMVVHLFVWFVSLLYLIYFHARDFKKSLPSSEDIFIGITWVMISIFVVYSAFGLQVDQFSDFFKGFLPWMQTGTKGMGHEKVWYYWFQIAQMYEIWVFGALAFGVVALWKKDAWLNYFFINSVGVLIIYSLIKYKTPWCSLSIFTFFPFLVGIGMRDEQPKAMKRMVPLFALLMIWEGRVLYRVNYVNYTDNSEMYVYVHTTQDYFKITKPVQKVVKDHPELRNMELVMQLESPWPLNWEFTTFTNIRYSFENIDISKVKLFVVDKKHQDALEKILPGTFLRQQMKLRHHMDDVVVYFDKDIFEPYGVFGEIVGASK